MPKKDRNRKQYDIPPEIDKVIKEYAAEYGIPESQIVAYLLVKGLLDIDNSDIKNWVEVRNSRHWNGDSFLEGYQITLREWCAMLRYYDNTCLSCGIRGEHTKLGKLTPDHVVPRSKVGAETIDNIQPLCWPCNFAKRDKAIDFRPYPLPDFVELARRFCPFKEVAGGQE